MLDQVAEHRHVGAQGPPLGELVGVAGRRQPAGQIVEVGLGDVDPEGDAWTGHYPPLLVGPRGPWDDWRMYDLLITGGTVVDGTGADPVRADIAITDGRIVAVGPDLDGPTHGTRSTPPGCSSPPGWVDIHTHYDGQVTWDPLLTPSELARGHHRG